MIMAKINIDFKKIIGKPQFNEHGGYGEAVALRAMEKACEEAIKNTIEQFREPINEVFNYLWKDELYNYEEQTGYTIQSQDDLNDWIHVCEKDKSQHIFYHLMKLKLLIENNDVNNNH